MGFLSDKFDISKGTEQGHPLSPDLFKIYIRDLSPQLDHENCPKLLNQLISHLLWADDLILLALDPETLQKQLDTLNSFCLEWGIEINPDKTKLMKFNARFDNYQPRHFKIGKHLVKEVNSYCYLGIEIHNSGSFTLARSELKKKAMRALYAMKNTVNKSKLSFRSLTTLFDSLIKPIVLYGAPIYTPSMSILKKIVKQADPALDNEAQQNFPINFLRQISLLNSEKVHLHFLKWSLGVNRKSVNAGVWGDSGRYPLLYESINLTIKYAQRLQNLKNDSLVSLAFKEQKNMKLDWYRGLEPILALDPSFTADHVTTFRKLNNTHSKHSSENHSKLPKEDFLIHNGFKKRIPSQSVHPIGSKLFTPHIILKVLKARFRESWGTTINTSRKLQFYRELKSNFTKENYLDHVTKYTDRANVTRLRISSHRLEIELGRHKQTPIEKRICSWCKIVLGTDTIENEAHFLNHCDLNATTRQKVLDKIQSVLRNPVSSTSTTISPDSSHTVSLNENYLKLITNDCEILNSITNESQIYISRVIAKFATTCINNRNKFTDSLAKT